MSRRKSQPGEILAPRWGRDKRRRPSRRRAKREHARRGRGQTVEVVNKYYATGQKYSREFRAAMPLEFDEDLPAWNYLAIPGAAGDHILN